MCYAVVMIALQALILGTLEGLTEFLPISSTFHLIWAAKVLRLPSSDFQKLFEVIIQSGAILAVVALSARRFRSQPALLKKVLVAFLPTAVVGFVLYQLIKDIFFENAALQLIVFLAVGLLFIFFESPRRRREYLRSLDSISYREALLVGLAQSLAVVPGVSRAGAVILALLFLGVRRDEAAYFSFLVAIPTILAAAVFDLYQTRSVVIASQEILMVSVGFLAAFITALVVVQWLIRYLQNHTLAIFGWYRVIFVAVLLIVWLIR